MNRPVQLLLDSLHSAISAVQAEAVLPCHLPNMPLGTLYVIGAGKAAAAMAATVERHWSADAPIRGLVLTRHGHGAATQRIEVVEAGHPLPDAHGMDGSARMLKLVANAHSDDIVLALLSGGGSSLLTLPEASLRLADIQSVTHALLLSGAPITEINCVRKHLSRTLGGKLAAACRAPARVLIISDVVGDDPAVIASGPFAPDPSTYSDCMAILERWSVDASTAILTFLHEGSRGRYSETVKPGGACFDHVQTRIIATAKTAFEAASAFFQRNGIPAIVLSTEVEAEARIVGREHAMLVKRHNGMNPPWPRPVVLLSGGEARVKVKGSGRGGRNTEYLLSLTLHLEGMPGIYALAADTDGIDGSEDNAGAWITPEHWQRARSLNLDAADYLARNDAYNYFKALGALVSTGATRTNVNDYRAILIT